MQNENKSSIIKLSASSVKSYSSCPRKYKYNYIDHIEKKQWDHFDLGNICHKVLEIFHNVYINEKTKNKKTLANLMGYAFSETRKYFEDKNINEDLYIEAKKLLTEYLDKIKLTGMPDSIGTETEFEFNISDSVLVKGVVDRLDVLKNGTYKIVDYKTTKNVKYLDDFQLLIYGLWLIKKYPNINFYEASYVLLRHNSTTKDYSFNLKDLDSAQKKLLDFSNKIKNDNEWVTIPSVLCNWCDFKDICPEMKAW